MNTISRLLDGLTVATLLRRASIVAIIVLGCFFLGSAMTVFANNSVAALSEGAADIGKSGQAIGFSLLGFLGLVVMFFSGVALPVLFFATLVAAGIVQRKNESHRAAEQEQWDAMPQGPESYQLNTVFPENRGFGG